MASVWIDISVALRNGMPHWPDNPPVRIERTSDLACGDEVTVSHLSLGSHTGTHMDAPAHFLRGGKGLDEMDPAETIGPARVVPIRDPAVISRREIEAQGVVAGERVLFRTRNSEAGWPEREFMRDFVYLSTEAAQWLAARRVRVVGTDYLSIGGYGKNGPEVHRILLQAGIWIIEGLDLLAAPPGPCDLLCLPLKILGSDGAPARALLRPRGGAG